MKSVTAAIIVEDERILIAQRAGDQKQAGKWEFPGGKIEPGETPEQCLIREIKEELSLDIAVDEYFGESIYPYDTGVIKLIAFKARRIRGELKLSVHSQIRWIRQNELDEFDYAPADLTFIEKLKRDWIS